MASTTTSTSGHSLPGVSRLICVANEKYPRFSEGDVIKLKDGRLLLALGRKEGSADFAKGTIVGFYSLDGGRSWDDEPHVIRATWDDKTDVYSTSFCRSGRGIHLFFMTRGHEPKRDTQVYQILSADEGKTWSEPERVSPRDGYHILNNARVVRTSKGRTIVPTAYVSGSIEEQFKHQRIYCTYSDDDGVTWKQSSELVLANEPLMEPGIAQCADGSLFMIIRTATGTNWQARSADDGATWTDLKSTGVPSPAAPSTVVRAPESQDLWLFWCNRGKTNWKGRTRIVFAKSSDHGKSWSEPRTVEENSKASFGYLSFLINDGHALVTYYDWRDNGQPNFQLTSLRERLIPLAWFKGEATPPVFQKNPSQPVLKADQPWEGNLVSLNSGVVVDGNLWRLWYTAGVLGPKGETLGVCYAESTDQGITWTKPKWADAPVKDSNVVFPAQGDKASYYHASVHRDGAQLVAYIWRQAKADDSCLWRFVSSNDGKTFVRTPADKPLMVSRWTKKELRAQAGEGRESNDAFDVEHEDGGTWSYYAASLVKATDPRTVFKQDNVAGLLRFIGRSQSADGMSFEPTEIILRPEYETRGEFDQQFYGMHVFRHRGFWLGLLHTFYLEGQIIQPEWAWSHDGVSWVRTRTPCIALGDEGAFDSRMILFGDIDIAGGEVIWIYSGMDWRHNAFKKGQVRSCIGRATMPLRELDAWLDRLPQP